MTKAHSEPGDNNGICESCSNPATKYQTQQQYPVMLGGGLGMGTMWLCVVCLKKHQDRDAALGKPRRYAVPITRNPSLSSPVPVTETSLLRAALVTFARELAAEQWHTSPSYERTEQDSIGEAKAETKADIGRALLTALGEKE